MAYEVHSKPASTKRRAHLTRLKHITNGYLPPITCTKLSYVDLEWEDFSSFWDLMQNDWKLEEYVYDHYLELGALEQENKVKESRTTSCVD
jgi:hypothetical protein